MKFYKEVKLLIHMTALGPFSNFYHLLAKSAPLQVNQLQGLFIFCQHILVLLLPFQGFPDSSVGKESTCNAGDPGSIPGLGRSPGEGIGYPIQYSRASLVAQLVKNLPAMRETWVRSLGWEDPLEKRKATYSCILAWRIP